MPGPSHIVAPLLCLAIASAVIVSGKGQCDFNLVTRNGIIEYPEQNYDHLFCKWTVLPPDHGSRLVVQVISATLPSNVDLIVYTDDNEYKINKDCQNCLENIQSSTLKVLLQWLPRNEDVTADFEPSFRIVYRSFTPGFCSKPRQISNGFVIGQNYKVGKSVMFVCNSPYQLVGDAIAQCAQKDESMVPYWHVGTPSCRIPKCSKGPIKLVATNRGSAIVNPGYASGGKVLPGQSCWWNIVSIRKDQQIKAFFKYFDLFDGTNPNDTSNVQLYDGSLDNLILELDFHFQTVSEITTESNSLIVIYFSGASVSRNATGFLMNYSSVSIKCPSVKVPINGEIAHKRKSYGLGDVISATCDNGYELFGGVGHIRCLISGQWSGKVGSCVLLNRTIVTVTLPPENVSDTFVLSDTRTDIMDYDPFELKTVTKTSSTRTELSTKALDKKYDSFERENVTAVPLTGVTKPNKAVTENEKDVIGSKVSHGHFVYNVVN